MPIGFGSRNATISPSGENEGVLKMAVTAAGWSIRALRLVESRFPDASSMATAQAESFEART